MKKRVYLDSASATPIRLGVLVRMALTYLLCKANPGANHHEGRRARDVLARARGTIASLLEVKPSGVIFTSGATESNNLAIHGYIEALRKKGRAYHTMHLITSRMEHPSVLKSVEELASRGVSISYVTPTPSGRVSPEAIRKLITKETVLLSFAYVQGDTGVIQPLRAIRRAAQEESKNIAITTPLLHTDATAAPLWLSVFPHRLGADLLTLDGQKMEGPRGSGLLVHSGRVPLAPLFFGGAQEGGIRPGTEDIGRAVGLASALVVAQTRHKARATRVGELRDELIRRVRAELHDAQCVGEDVERSPHIALLALPGRDTEYLCALLDKDGFSVSTKTTCEHTDADGSEALRAIPGMEKWSRHTLRVSLGTRTGRSDIRRFIEALKRNVAFLDATRL